MYGVRRDDWVYSCHLRHRKEKDNSSTKRHRTICKDKGNSRMSQGPKRSHPFIICFQIGTYLKNAFLPFLRLFVFNYQSDMFIWKYGRYVFLVMTMWTILSYGVKWLFKKYELSADAFYFYEGIFTKGERIVPYCRIQDIQQHRNIVHHILRHTSLRFETA